MLSGRSGERSNQTCVSAKTAEYKRGAQKLFIISVLFGADIHAEPAPPHLAYRIEARLFLICFLL